MIKFNINKDDRVKPNILINIGACLDIPTSSILTGKEGESIINGGLAYITGITGAGNNFKSTISHYMGLSATNKIMEATPTYMLTYDTECNIMLDRLESLASNFKNIPDNAIQSEDATWVISNKDNRPANDWAVDINKYAEEKAKDKGSKIIFQCFREPYSTDEKGKPKQLEAPIPSFVEIDSFSQFEAQSTMDMLSKDLDSSDTNTYAMKQGLFKTKFMSTLPVMSSRSNTYFILTAHIGEKLDMATGPAKYNQPTKKLQYLKSSDNIKGVGSNFSFLTTSLWFAHTASLLVNQNTGLAEYPADGNDKQKTDLNTVKLTMLRNKNGPSGHTITLVISQVEGVLPTLTEFHYIKENNRFGLEGSNVSYHLDIYPEVNLSRTTVRSKIDNDPKLCRAINITSELLQAGIFHQHLYDSDLMCTPKELYEDIKKLGYDWDILLQTRGYWTINQYDNPVPFLSTIDLLRMRKELYFPYFLNNDKTLKSKYNNKSKMEKKK